MTQRIAIFAPVGRDAAVIEKIFGNAGIDSVVLSSMDAILDVLDRGHVGCLVVAEEALTKGNLTAIGDWISRQPPWSDVPVILLTLQRTSAISQAQFAGPLGNVTILERPFHPFTLISAANAALRARMRQHEAQRYIQELAAERQALQESESRYRTLFETMDEGFCIIEFVDGQWGPMSDYVHVSVNSAYERHTGIKNAVGRKVRDMVPEEAEGWIELYRNVLVTGHSIRFDRELVATNRHLELAAFRIEPKERRQVAVIFQDQTARFRAEKALRHLNENLEQRIANAISEKKLFVDIVEGTDAFVQVADNEYRWLAVNRAAKQEFERIFGVRPEVGRSMLAALDHMPEQQAEVRRVWSRALSGEEFTEIAEFGVPGGPQSAYEMKFNVLRDNEGRQIGAYQFVYDVTERLKDQARLQEANARVHEMAKLETLGQLTGGVAHDFNNLLTPIVGALDMLKRRHSEDPRSSKMISGAMQASERATILVQRLLAFARRQNLQARLVDIGDLVEGMSDLIQRSIGQHINIEFDLGKGALANVDPNQLELAVLNLAVNARDAMPAGGSLYIGVGRVRIRTPNGQDLESGDYVRLVVRDTGVGMDDATLRRSIEPFFTTKGQDKGTGLGLSMVHGMAAQSGGAMKIESKQRVGTTVELFFPLAEGIAETSIAPVLFDTNPQTSARILLVDDEALVRSATANMLREMGHTVTEAATPAAALDVIASDAGIDLLVTDYLMPQMRGNALIVDAKQLRPDLRALLITGYAHLTDEESAEIPRLAKPFREAELQKVISNLLARQSGETSGDAVRAGRA